MRPSRTPTHVFMDVWLERVRLCLLGIGIERNTRSEEVEFDSDKRWTLTPAKNNFSVLTEQMCFGICGH
jgi:hypothetical protein